MWLLSSWCTKGLVCDVATTLILYMCSKGVRCIEGVVNGVGVVCDGVGVTYD